MNKGIDREWSPTAALVTERLAEEPLQRLDALLNRDPEVKDYLPPLTHWLFFLATEHQSSIGPDGHAVRGGFFPPITAPRRMWAGGNIDFDKPLRIGAVATRRSIVDRVDRKTGASGELTFVTVRHEISADGDLCIRERQDLVFLDGKVQPRPPALSDRVATAGRQVSLDVTALFRFSALTFNAHRIHYDIGYARETEGYAGLVVHGPLQAILLADLLNRSPTRRSLRSFSFRSVRPLIAGTPMGLNAADGETAAALWTTDADGSECMRAEAVFA